MKNQRTPAQLEYEAALENLREFCETSTDLTPIIIDSEYPIRVQFIPDMQFSMFGNENVDENGEVNDLTITCGLSVTVKSTLKFKMDSKLLKKLIKLAEKVGFYYYHAFREEQGERITPQRPDASGCCPACGDSIPFANLEPAFCQSCAQALDWSPAPEPDEYEEGLEKLKELVDREEAEE